MKKQKEIVVIGKVRGCPKCTLLKGMLNARGVVHTSLYVDLEAYEASRYLHKADPVRALPMVFVNDELHAYGDQAIEEAAKGAY